VEKICSKYTKCNYIFAFFQKILTSSEKQWNESSFLPKQQQRHSNQTKTIIIKKKFCRRQKQTKKSFAMLAMINRLLEWFKSLFWKEEMELTLVNTLINGHF
jgi:hypothetical protein